MTKILIKKLILSGDQRASFDVVEQEAQEGDYIKCSYEGELDGKAVAEIVPDKPMYGKQTEAHLGRSWSGKRLGG